MMAHASSKSKSSGELSGARQLAQRLQSVKYVWRILENIDSVREGLQIWAMFIVGGFLLGLGWASREIYDSWGRD